MRANSLNTGATSCFSIGVLGPLAAAFYNVKSDGMPLHVVIIGVAFWFGCAYILHKRAQAALGGLQDD